MKLKCLQCGHEFEGSISLDELGWHSSCPSCGGSFDVDLPEGRFAIAFADDSDPSKDRANFTDTFPGAAVRTYHAFDTPEAFVAFWNQLVEQPEGMWYWCLDFRSESPCEEQHPVCFCSGACDPGDIDCFAEYPPLAKAASASKWRGGSSASEFSEMAGSGGDMSLRAVFESVGEIPGSATSADLKQYIDKLRQAILTWAGTTAEGKGYNISLYRVTVPTKKHGMYAFISYNSSHPNYLPTWEAASGKGDLMSPLSPQLVLLIGREQRRKSEDGRRPLTGFAPALTFESAEAFVREIGQRLELHRNAYLNALHQLGNALSSHNLKTSDVDDLLQKLWTVQLFCNLKSPLLVEPSASVAGQLLDYEALFKITGGDAGKE